jgi:type III secretion protein K
MSLLRFVLQHNLHPEATLHPSWLPADWPARHRAAMRRLKPTAQAVLGEVLRQRGVAAAEPDYHFDSRLKRLLLLDAASLRRLAFYTSLCAHAPLLRPRRDAVSAQMRRQARRIDADAVEFVLDRAPRLSELQMSAQTLQERPSSCGRVLAERGYRLLLAVLAPEGQAVVQRLRYKLPRRVAALQIPQLSPRQVDQLNELMLSCIVPERLAPWDWLF